MRNSSYGWLELSICRPSYHPLPLARWVPSVYWISLDSNLLPKTTSSSCVSISRTRNFNSSSTSMSLMRRRRFTKKRDSRPRHFPIIPTTPPVAISLRNRRKSLLEVTKKITQKSLDNNKSYAFFTEGKTSTGKTIQQFHSGLFSLFLENQELTLLPVLIKYKKDDVFTEVCAYVGDTTLLESVVRIIKNSNLSAEVQIMPVSTIKNNGDNKPGIARKYLASQTRLKMLEIYHQ